MERGCWYEIAETADAQSLGGIRVLNDDGVVWEVTGKVVCAEGYTLGECSSLVVVNEWAKPIAIPSSMWVVCGLSYYFVVFVCALSLESWNIGSYDGPPWWRLCFSVLICAGFAYSVMEGFGLAFCGKTSSSLVWKLVDILMLITMNYLLSF